MEENPPLNPIVSSGHSHDLLSGEVAKENLVGVVPAGAEGLKLTTQKWEKCTSFILKNGKCFLWEDPIVLDALFGYICEHRLRLIMKLVGWGHLEIKETAGPAPPAARLMAGG